MLIPHAAVTYARDAEEWKVLMTFLSENDCLIGDMRRDPRNTIFDETINAVRINNDRFWKGCKSTYVSVGPEKYGADSAWWCIPGYDFIAMHQTWNELGDDVDCALLESIM